MKKKILYSVFIFAMLSSFLLADGRFITADTLPAKAKTFLSTYFPKIDIVHAEQDRDSYEVNLKNGVEVEFMKNGEWESVDGKYQAIPTGFIPSAVLNAVKKAYPKASIIKVDKDWGGFDIELDNRMELKVAANGTIHEAEYDD